MFLSLAPDDKTTAYAMKITKAITSHWRSSDLDPYVSPQFFKYTSRRDDEKMFKWFQRIGRVTALRIVASRKTAHAGLHGRYVDADFKFEGESARGPVTIYLRLRDTGDGWKVFGLRVYSDALIGS